jgi:hypothetical protein
VDKVILDHKQKKEMWAALILVQQDLNVIVLMGEGMEEGKEQFKNRI